MMKPIHKVVLRSLFRSKSFYLFLLIVCAFAVRAVVHVRHGISSSQGLGSALLDIYYGVISDKVMELLFIPFFLLMLGIISDVFDNYKVLLKYSSAKQWWKEKMLGSAFFAVICALAILVIVLGAVILSGHARDLDAEFVEFLMLGLLMQFIGFAGLGVLYQLIVLKFAHKYVGFFVTVLVVFLLDLIKTVFKLKFTTPQEYMSLMYKWNSGQVSVGAPDLVPLVFLAFVFVALYLVGVFQSQDKDFYWSE